MIISRKRDNCHIISVISIISNIVYIELDDENGFRHELIDAIINIKPNTVAHYKKVTNFIKKYFVYQNEIILVLISYQ